MIEVKSGVYDFTINPSQSHIIEQGGEGPKDVSEKNYVPPMTSALIIYSSTKCDTLDTTNKIGTGEGIIGISNYINEKIGNRHYKFAYTFTDIDYKKALPCK